MLVAAYCALPYYARQALVHLMPDINDLETFERHTVRHDHSHAWQWHMAGTYNRYRLSSGDSAYLDSLHTRFILVIRGDSLLFESYRDGWNDTLTSNIYSATKTIVGLLAASRGTKAKSTAWTTPSAATSPRTQRGNRRRSPSAPAHHERRHGLG